MLKELEQRRSWMTQRLANYYPPWSKIRQLAQSVGQQMMEPLGRNLEDFHWWSTYDLGNYLLATSDINQLDGINVLSLPSNFEWRTRHRADKVVYLIPTEVKGRLSDGSWVTLSEATNNRVEEFWYGVPTRITSASESYTYNPILDPVQVTSLSSSTIRTIPFPTRLWITITNNGASAKNYAGKIARSRVDITGYTIHGDKVTETIKFLFNGSILTKFIWEEITSIETKYIDDNAYIRVDWLSHVQSDQISPTGIVATDKNESLLFYSLGTKSFGSTLQHKTFDAFRLTDIEDGSDSKHTVYETQLLDSSGNNVSGSSLALWPKRRWAVVNDTSKLHFFCTELPYEELTDLSEATLEPAVTAYTEYEWYCQGDTVSLDMNLRRPSIKVFRTRWSVLKPDGTKVSLNETGSEIPYSASAWITHTQGTTFSKVGLQSYIIEYTLTSRGKYVFYLESTIVDLTGEVKYGKPAITQTDIRIIHSSYDTALASVSTPTNVGTLSSVGFDAYQRPWVINTSGIANRINFHHDVYITDYTDKKIYLREDYDFVEVEA